MELLNSPSEIISEDNLKKENDKEEFSEETEIKLLKQAENVGELENLTFLNQCITLLSKYKDITAYKKKIEEMKNHQFFSNISEYEKYSQILQDLIKENIGEENREYLTISIKYCPRIPELVKSIQSTIKTDEEIKKEISRRLNIIANVLEENNITLYSYLCDIGNRSIPNVLANETPTKEEFEDLIKEIKISRKEKFSHLIAFVEDPKNIRNRMPSARAKNNREKELGIFVGNIRRVRAQKRYTLLDKEQLEYLSNSRIEGLNQIYRDILLDTTQNNIKLDYVDEKSRKRIEEYSKKIKDKGFRERMDIEKEYADVIKMDKFSALILFVESPKNKGHNLPRHRVANKKEKELAEYIRNITQIQIPRSAIFLNREKLKYLHDSEIPDLKEVYRTILYKAVIHNIEIDYVDEQMKKRIEEYQESIKGKNLRERMNIDREYKDVIKPRKFSEFVLFVENSENKEGILHKLPGAKSKHEKERELGEYRQRIQMRLRTLGEEELKYLHDSEIPELREIYQNILYKAVVNKTKIGYIDEQMKERIEEYEKLKKGKNLKERVQLEREYKELIKPYISKFSEFVLFVENSENKEGVLHKLPSTSTSDPKEKELGNYRNKIQTIRKKEGKDSNFFIVLNEEQLAYLHDSEIAELNVIYNNIMGKAHVNGVKKYIEIDKRIKENLWEEKERSGKEYAG